MQHPVPRIRAMTAVPAAAPTPAYRRKLFWVALLYFSEGLPLGVFYDLFPVYFRQQGVNLADIGLLGSLMPGPDGTRIQGFQVHVGGHLGPDAAFATRVKGVRVPADDLEDYLESVLRRFLDTREEDETFHEWSARADQDWFALPDPALVS